MSNGVTAELTVAIYLALSTLCSGADGLDYSKEAVVIQNMTTSVRFTADGARE